MLGLMTKVEWTQMHEHILELCPNLRHLEIRGFEEDRVDALVDVLKKKSLVSFSVSGQALGALMSFAPIRFTQILDMMQKWPNLQSIRVEADTGFSHTENKICYSWTNLNSPGAALTFEKSSPSVFHHQRVSCPALDVQLWHIIALCSPI